MLLTKANCKISLLSINAPVAIERLNPPWVQPNPAGVLVASLNRPTRRVCGGLCVCCSCDPHRTSMWWTIFLWLGARSQEVTGHLVGKLTP
jgi:hypothetical protein